MGDGSSRCWKDRIGHHLDWIWKSIVSSICGSLAHALLMAAKVRVGLLPDFDPASALQLKLTPLLANIPLLNTEPWLLSQLNGATLIGLLFGGFYRHLPGDSGLAKGFLLGVAGWLMLSLVLFPLLGLGPFGGAFGPAAFSFAMVQAFSLVLGSVYAVLQRVGNGSTIPP
jgi:hypothetical protein